MYELRDKIVVQNVGTYSQRPTVSTYMRHLIPIYDRTIGIYDIKGAVNRGDNNRKIVV